MGETSRKRSALSPSPACPLAGVAGSSCALRRALAPTASTCPAHGERFLSREAYGLRYAVEHDTALDSDIERVCRLFTQISGEPPPSGALSPPPPRRKGMHERTYGRLTWKFMVAKGP